MLTYSQLETIAKDLGWTTEEVEQGIAELNDGFMVIDVESFLTDGEILAEDGEPLSAGVYGRLSAPGYMDCTDWHGPFDTEEEAVSALLSCYCD